MHNDELPYEVILAIQHVLEASPAQEADPLDGLSQEFSPMLMLNDLFPNEASLAHIDSVSQKLNERQEQLQKEIDELELELKKNQDPERMTLIQEMISDLLGQMSRIREKASESEAVVRDITKDIQVLDLAKQNLISSMTMLRRLQMLVHYMTQLEDYIKEKRYKDVSDSLVTVKEIFASTFKPYTSVQQISSLWRRIQEIQGELRTQLDATFDSFYLQDTTKQIKPALISDACLVVDVLGSDFRLHLIERYVALELKEYRRIFRTNDEAGQLDNISRRFAWFHRLIRNHEIEQGRVFPPTWKVGWFLLAKFSEITRDDLTALLSKAASSLTVKSLLDDLQQTVEFEVSMAKKWATPFADMLKFTGGTGQPPKTISSAFEPHLGIFVDAQDKVLAEMLAPHRKKGKAPPRTSLETTSTSTEENEKDEPPMVLPSSTELFYFYAQSLDQCAKLSTGQALFDLCNLHKKWLRIYAEEVLSLGASKQRPPSRKSTESRYDLNEIKQACLIINTADYCQTTASGLEEKIKGKINDDFKEKVSLQKERDLFVSVISAAITVLLREVENATDVFFTTMSRSTWSNQNQVSGQSAYVEDLVKAAEQGVEIIKPLIEQKKYVRNFLDKVCSLILVKFTNALVRSRPLKEIGAEQLLIDLQVVKGYLTKMPGENLVTNIYTKALTKTTTRLEALLKVIVTPVDPKENFILNYTFLIGDASLINFQKILDLKGVPRAVEKDLEDTFLMITSTKTDLDSTSFLSSLDMDPPLTGHVGIGSLVSPGASRVSLPLGTSSAEGIFQSLSGGGGGGGGGGSTQSGPPTGSSGGDTGSGSNRAAGETKREVFSDFRRFVSFGLRKDSVAPS